MFRNRSFYVIVGALFIVCMLGIASVLLQGQYYVVSMVILLIGFIPLWFRLERKLFKGRELVLIAVLSAITVISRVPFSFIPGFQPSSMLIMAFAWMLGPEIGWLVGMNTAWVSNFFLGQGPWTPWQMLAWGLMGLTAGWMRNVRWMERMSGKMIFGFLWGFFFGWIMDLWVASGGIGILGYQSVLHVFTISFFHDLIRAISNVVFIWLLWKPVRKILLRFQEKYGTIGSSNP